MKGKNKHVSDIPIWVLDINVVVAALLSPHGPPGRLLDAVITGYLQIAFDDRIESEYKAVLARKKFGFAPQLICSLFAEFDLQKRIIVPPLNSACLPDSDDLPFLEVASVLDDPVLVTGNIKHCPLVAVGKVIVLSPHQAWERLRYASEECN